jgi:hypothetical protein
MSCGVTSKMDIKCGSKFQYFVNQINIIHGKVYFDTTCVGDVVSRDSDKIIYKEPNGELREILLIKNKGGRPPRPKTKTVRVPVAILNEVERLKEKFYELLRKSGQRTATDLHHAERNS